MGRKKDEIWEYAKEKSANGHFECKFCKVTFAGGATRIKEHLAGQRTESTLMTGKEKKKSKS